MLSTVKFNYNVDWIKGPRQTHLSLATSKAFILVSAPENMKEGDFIFGEIELEDTETGIIYGKVPVTLIRPFKAKTSKALFEWSPEILSDSAKRSFIYIDENIKALELNFTNKGFDTNSYLELYDPQGNKLYKSDRPDFTNLIETKQKGYYQLVMNRQGGSYKSYTPSITARALSMKVMDPMIFRDSPEVVVQNNFKSGLYRVSLYKKLKPLSVKYKSAKVNEEAVFNYDLDEGTHKFKISTQRKHFIKRPYAKCKANLFDENGVVVKKYSGGSDLLRIKVKPSYGKSKLEVKCFNFERTTASSTSLKTIWKLENIPNEIVSKPVATKMVVLKGEGQLTEVKFTNAEFDDTTESVYIEIGNSTNESRGLTLGSSDLID